MINYSIIIPHKNIPSLLQRCLDSIPVRDDVQVIVVDDNSDTELVDFNHFPQWGGDCYEYYLTKEGKGAGYARNVGLEHAKGRWLVFADADDYFMPAVSHIFDDEINTEEDIVFFRPRLVENDNVEKASKRGGYAYNSYIDSYLGAGGEMELRTRWHSPWSKFINASLVIQNDIHFEETKYSNDVLFSTLTGCKANRIVARDISYYVVTERSGSLTSDFCHKAGELETRASVFFEVQQIVKKFDYPIDDSLAFRYLYRLYDGNREQFKEYFKAFRKLSGYSRKELIDSIFESNSFVSRLKRKACAFFITAF